MPGTTTTFTTARFLTADYIVAGVDNALSCPLWHNGALVAPTSGTVTVYDASNTAIVTDAAVTVTASIATYTLAAALVPTTLSRGMGWRIEWSLVVAGVTTVYRNAAGLVRSQLAPVITDGDLYALESCLDPAGSAPVSSLTTFQTKIDAAWLKLHGWLVGKGNLVHLIMEPAALRELHLCMTLELVFNDFRTRLSETWKEKYEDYKEQARTARDGLAFEYDSTDSGQSDGRRKRSAQPFVFLGGCD